MAIKILKGGVSRKNQRGQAEEAKIIQEIYHGLGSLEKRMEALETIILEGRRKDPTS
jgi:phage shock protein B